jgi:hypothetical protein
MKKKSGNDHADTMRQRKYPMPGTDLETTTAIPYDGAYDVDISAGDQSLTGGPVATMSFTRTDRSMRCPHNPTRAK